MAYTVLSIPALNTLKRFRWRYMCHSS